jgi:hypothetical protein
MEHDFPWKFILNYVFIVFVVAIVVAWTQRPSDRYAERTEFVGDCPGSPPVVFVQVGDAIFRWLPCRRAENPCALGLARIDAPLVGVNAKGRSYKISCTSQHFDIEEISLQTRGSI